MMNMKFTRQIKINTLAEDVTHNGEIFGIEKVAKGDYYDVKVKTKDGMISIWVSDSVTPEHPLFEVFDAYIDDESEAEDFDEKEIIGTPIEFTVKNIVTRNKKGVEAERSFFDKVTPLFDETEEDDSNEE